MKQYGNNVLIVALVCLIGFAGYLRFSNEASETFSLATASKIIVIDPGHGGHDPGKVGSKGIYEDEINLNIAMKLRDYLEQSGATVIMTREDDSYLEGPSGTTHKGKDMSFRKEIMQVSEADIIVSLHQNAFTDPEVHGAQVFYYESSNEAKSLATSVQEAIKVYVDGENNRPIMSSKDYYILKMSQIPGIIVECGFLTNPVEEQLLISDIYQDKMAWGIYRGIINYFEEEQK